jgi:maltose 6'-phosphate phosphatase
MKVLSLNLHLFTEADRFSKLDKITEYIKANEIDICLFQECCQTKDEEVLYDNVKKDNNAYYIANKLGYNMFFHHFKTAYETLDEGLAIVTRFPIVYKCFFTISKTTDTTGWLRRDIIGAQIGDFMFFNAHLGWDVGGETGLEQIEKLRGFLDYFYNPFILGGDFNYPDNSDEINTLKLDMFSFADLADIDSYSNPTFHYELDSKIDYKGNRMIDYIFTSHKLALKKFEIVFNNEEDYVSDHSGIMVEYQDVK